MILSTVLRAAFGTVLVSMLPSTVFGSTVSFSQTSTPGRSSTMHADFNKDGREDFVNLENNGFSVRLSTGNGTYAAPVNYSLPTPEQATTIVIGDFSGDGNADVAIFSSYPQFTSHLHLYVNDGSGRFSVTASYAIPAFVTGAVAADFNHDSIMDIAFQSATNFQQSNAPLTIWFGNGKGGFRIGPTQTDFNVGTLLVGDFDGDSHIDLAIADNEIYNNTTVNVHYGDGKGNFPTHMEFTLPGGRSVSGVADVNSDGTSDIVAYTFLPTLLHHMFVYYGNARRSWTDTTTIPIAHCLGGVPLVADINGDGIKDLVVPETDDCTSSQGIGNNHVGILTRNSNATYNPDQTVYTTPSTALVVTDLSVLRANADAKPDLSFTECQIICNPADASLHVLLNTSAGNFHSCLAPNAFEGINVCSPVVSSVVRSPVPFRLAAAGQGDMRKMEVWVDGRKLVEQLNGFSHYTFLDHALYLSTGLHQVNIYAAGWDNSLQRKSFRLEVQ